MAIGQGGQYTPGGTSTMPAGGTDSPSGGQQPEPQATSTAKWLPVMRIGQGQPGVFTDARGMIAGEPATLTAKDVASSASGIASALSGAAAGAAAGASTGSSLGASTMPTGGTDATPSGAGPTPKATSQAQRQANLDQAYKESGTVNPDPNVP